MLFAYLDPVTGSAILQVLLGALAVVGLGWQYIRRGFNNLFNRTPKAEVEPESETTSS